MSTQVQSPTWRSSNTEKRLAYQAPTPMRAGGTPSVPSPRSPVQISEHSTTQSGGGGGGGNLTPRGIRAIAARTGLSEVTLKDLYRRFEVENASTPSAPSKRAVSLQPRPISADKMWSMLHAYHLDGDVALDTASPTNFAEGSRGGPDTGLGMRGSNKAPHHFQSRAHSNYRPASASSTASSTASSFPRSWACTPTLSPTPQTTTHLTALKPAQLAAKDSSPHGLHLHRRPASSMSQFKNGADPGGHSEPAILPPHTTATKSPRTPREIGPPSPPPAAGSSVQRVMGRNSCRPATSQHSPRPPTAPSPQRGTLTDSPGNPGPNHKITVYGSSQHLSSFKESKHNPNTSAKKEWDASPPGVIQGVKMRAPTIVAAIRATSPISPGGGTVPRASPRNWNTSSLPQNHHREVVSNEADARIADATSAAANASWDSPQESHPPESATGTQVGQGDSCLRDGGSQSTNPSPASASGSEARQSNGASEALEVNSPMRSSAKARASSARLMRSPRSGHSPASSPRQQSARPSRRPYGRYEPPAEPTAPSPEVDNAPETPVWRGVASSSPRGTKKSPVPETPTRLHDVGVTKRHQIRWNALETELDVSHGVSKDTKRLQFPAPYNLRRELLSEDDIKPPPKKEKGADVDEPTEDAEGPVMSERAFSNIARTTKLSQEVLFDLLQRFQLGRMATKRSTLINTDNGLPPDFLEMHQFKAIPIPPLSDRPALDALPQPQSVLADNLCLRPAITSSLITLPLQPLPFRRCRVVEEACPNMPAASGP
ncbi:hypothetical protein CYMTET_34107 [Cymbomonas tetramitiformis]|uniref:Uncharacterized protein n=1 Tax=Cymbomonas tetramitiformis TaxID=36881 RepID=A0AAE0KQJ2_9CHLO|nr:hypothetical protein CYMTET_34107 [Cymbomonas tetramitiformis]